MISKIGFNVNDDTEMYGETGIRGGLVSNLEAFVESLLSIPFERSSWYHMTIGWPSRYPRSSNYIFCKASYPRVRVLISR